MVKRRGLDGERMWRGTRRVDTGRDRRVWGELRGRGGGDPGVGFKGGREDSVRLGGRLAVAGAGAGFPAQEGCESPAGAKGGE